MFFTCMELYGFGDTGVGYRGTAQLLCKVLIQDAQPNRQLPTAELWVNSYCTDIPTLSKWGLQWILTGLPSIRSLCTAPQYRES